MIKLTGSLEHSLTAPSPPIDVYLPANGGQNGIGLVIFPGGGYGGLAEHEGKGYADYFTREGIACFVVKYRLAPEGARHPAMLEDALAAVGTVRARAGEFGVSQSKIGVIGSSAGGHLAAHSLVAAHEYESSVPVRPDFGVLCYPVIVMNGEYCHKGSRENLLGPNPPAALMDEVSCERRVSGQTPPCFIWHTYEDPSVPVENSMLFAAALRKHGVPFELHIYHKGRHGLGLNTDFSWGADCVRWMREIV